LARDVEPVTPEELDLIDGRPAPVGTYIPWLRPLSIPPRRQGRDRAGEGEDDLLDG
jgi:hypothetical protein